MNKTKLKLMAAMQRIITRMAAGDRLSVRPAWFKAWTESANEIVSIEAAYSDVTALEELKLIEIQEIAPPLWRMRLTPLGRELAKAEGA